MLYQHRHCTPDDDVVFLFQTPSPDGAPYFSDDDDDAETSMPTQSLFHSNVILPLAVKNMMANPRAILRPHDQKAALGQSYCFCKALVEEHEKFWGAFRALLTKGKAPEVESRECRICY